MPPDDLPLKVAVLETKVANHDAIIDRMLKLQEVMATDIHAIRETIATAKGGWWGAGLVLTAMAAIAGGVGAMVHRLMSS